MSALALGSTKATNAAKDCQCMTGRSKREDTFRKGIRKGSCGLVFIGSSHGGCKGRKSKSYSVERTGGERVSGRNE